MPSGPGGGIRGYIQRLLDPESPVSVYHRTCEALYGLAPAGFGWIYQGPQQTTCDLARDRPRSEGSFFEDVLAQAPKFAGVGLAVATGGTGILPLALTSTKAILAPELPTERFSQTKAIGPITEVKMPAQDDWGFGDLFSGFGDFFADTTFQDISPLIAPTISYFGGGQAQVPAQRVSSPLISYGLDPSMNGYGGGRATPVMAEVPTVVRMGATALRSLWNSLRVGGVHISMQRVASLLKKYGPSFFFGWLADEVLQRAFFEAVIKKHRRMNPGNVKALRRSMRRVKSFHRLCTHVDVLKSRGRSRGRTAACPTCKKSPCRC